MKGCIFQKQDPVNIPQIETGVLTDVLALPWGVEIYGLLHALEPAQPRIGPIALPYNGKNVLVVGLGPAGYTLAHYLLNEGFGVVGIDGLKIEPLPADWTGADGKGIRPIRDYVELARPLDQRPLAGFGGVSEYGITVRWDKNFLTLVHLTLARRQPLRDPRRRSLRRDALGRSRPSTPGFDHVAIAAGAGRPTIIPHEEQHHPGRAQGLGLPDGPAADRRLQGRGPRQPPGGAAGGRHRRRPDGHRHGDGAARLLPAPGRKDARALRDARRRARAKMPSGRSSTPRSGRSSTGCSPTARPCATERERARAAGEAPDLARLCREWGGVSIAYRRSHGGVSRLSPQPRGGHQGARGGDLVHREPRARGGRPRRARQALRSAVPARAAPARSSSCPPGPARRRRHDAQHHLREGVPRLPPARRRSGGSSPLTGRSATATA